jgi:hypothetical protein
MSIQELAATKCTPVPMLVRYEILEYKKTVAENCASAMDNLDAPQVSKAGSLTCAVLAAVLGVAPIPL